MAHKSLMLAALVVLVACVAIPVGTGILHSVLCVAEYLLLIACGVTSPGIRRNETSLSDMDLALVTIDDGSDAGLSDRERTDRLIDKLSLRSVRTVDASELSL